MEASVELLRAGEVRSEFGWNRSTLLRWEEQGLISEAVVRTPGGQRRYRRSVLQGMIGGATEKQPAGPNPTQRPLYSEMGVSGLRRQGGQVLEERLRELQGRNGRALLREIRVNDPVVSAIFFAIESALRKVSVRVRGPDNPLGRRAAEHVDQCLHDMSFSWHDQFTLILEVLEQGFSCLELVYKLRLGPNPPSYVPDPASSKFSDGMVAWRKWAPRPAVSLAPGDEWILDETGGVQGINQQPEMWVSIKTPIPISKLLHFRTTVYPGNTPEGLPIHRAMYLPWYYSSQLQEIEGIGVLRNEVRDEAG